MYVDKFGVSYVLLSEKSTYVVQGKFTVSLCRTFGNKNSTSRTYYFTSTCGLRS